MMLPLSTTATLPFQAPAESAAGGETSTAATDFWSFVTEPEAWVRVVVEALPMVGKAVGVLIVFYALLRILRPMLRRALVRAKLEGALIDLLVDGFFRWILWAFGIVMAAGQLGVDVTAAIAGLGIAGLAVGLAAQDTIANIIAGITIFLDKPFKVHDWIEVTEVTGCVAEIKMRTTRIRTRQNTYLVIPNKQVIDSVIVNHSMYGDVRVDIPIGIAYKEQIAAAREVILGALQAVDFITADRTEVVSVALGSSSVDLQLRVWVHDAELEARALVECLEVSKVALDRAGIQIPFPHLQLFVESVEPPAVESLRRALAS